MENRKDEGFTLIELLIVIVILGILATIVVFAVRGVTSDAQANSCEASEKTYEVAIEAWYALGATAVDADANGHPTGEDLVASGLMRDYDSAGDVTVTEGSGTAITDSSTVALSGACAAATGS